MTGISFPRLAARDLDGRDVMLPAGLPGEWNVVVIAFRREQQELADSWVPWLEQRAAVMPRLRFVELPAIGLQWQPARPVIDGGMAAAIRDQQTRRRTLTVYTDVRRVTVPLGIGDRSTIWLFLVDRAGRVRWRGSGGWDAAAAATLAAALDGLPEHPARHTGGGPGGRAVRDGVRPAVPAASRRAGGDPGHGTRHRHRRPPGRLFRAVDLPHGHRRMCGRWP